MISTYAGALAHASCSRCHKRKKRCDRQLPACKDCLAAGVRCSFQDDSGEMASFPIAYVRHLEDQVQQLSAASNQQHLENRTPTQNTTQHATVFERRISHQEAQSNALDDNNTPVQHLDIMRNPLESGFASVVRIEQLPAVNPSLGLQNDSIMTESIDLDPDQLDPSCLDLSIHQLETTRPEQDVDRRQSTHSQNTAPAPVQLCATTKDQYTTFAQELKTLTLEATAERHLGSSSGLSFAKLTQTVLKRLSPDKADLVFTLNQDDTAATSFFNMDSPSDLFNEAMYEELSGSISIHPILFGDLFLTDITEFNGDIVDLAWPSDQGHVRDLVEFYFAHSHTLYPILDKDEVLQSIEKIQGQPENQALQSALEHFRLWMVLAIGSTAYASLSLTEESESMLYYSKALLYFDQALEQNEMSALETLMLQVSYSFFNQLGPNTWFLVGTSARLALGLGLHVSSTYTKLPLDEQQRRKRMFFSIYMMDRVVSIALGRPFAIHDDDIDVSPFTDQDAHVSDSNDIFIGTVLQPSLLSVPLHILRLRQLSSKIARHVYGTKENANRSVEDGQRILTSLQQELLDWRRSIPFPIPESAKPVPHLHTLWYDFNYYTHLAMIYRPSPLSPTLTPESLKTLGMAASMSLRQAATMHQQHRFAYNWLNFLAIFTATLSLVYATTARSDELSAAVSQSHVVEDLKLALQLFEALGVKFTPAKNIKSMVEQILERYQAVATATAPQ